MVGVKNLVAGHHRHQILRLRQVDDVVGPAGNHVDSLNFVPGNFKLHRFSSVDVSLLNQSVTRVWTFAKTIGELEHIDAETQYILEVAAITHDIACPLCRKKYGSADGKHQELEGGPLVREFLHDTGLTPAQVDRVAYLVSHHHTLTDIDGIDYQILIEADYIVNAAESEYSKESIKGFINKVMQTNSGSMLARQIFCV